MLGAMPFPDSTFDLVHSRWAFHNGFPLRTLWEIHRVLRPGGHVLLWQNEAVAYMLNRVVQWGTREVGWQVVFDSQTDARQAKAMRNAIHQDRVVLLRSPIG